MQSSAQIEKNRYLLSEVYNLPSMPLILFEVTKLLDSSTTSVAELVKVISRDQGLTAKILTVANSPFYGLPRKIATIDFAIVILGFEQIKSIVIAISIMNSIKGISDAYLDQKEFWAHSVLVAVTSKKLTEDLGYHFSGEAFTAGLLHDLGISVMHKYFHKEYKEIYNLVINQNMPCKEAELEVIGLSHEEVGKILTEKWNFPMQLKDAISFHHYPSNSEQNKILTSIIHLADYMTHKLEICSYYWDRDFILDPGIYSTLNLGNEEYLDKLIQSYKGLFIKQMETLNI